MEISRRPAAASDRKFLREANARAYEDVVVRQFGGWDRELQEARFNEKWERAHFEVIEDGGERVGAIWVTDEGEYRQLREVFILPAHQGRGIGSQLVQQEFAEARLHNKPLRLRVLRMSRARAFYERMGFTVCGETETQFWMEAV